MIKLRWWEYPIVGLMVLIVGLSVLLVLPVALAIDLINRIERWDK
jgi:hypothetical protein